jgi:hypothetical protein
VEPVQFCDAAAHTQQKNNAMRMMKGYLKGLLKAVSGF